LSRSDGKPCAVVLAAGASTRMGRPKSLIQWRGQAFVTHVVGLADRAGCRPIVVVDGAVVLPSDVLAGATRITNGDWQAGQLSSLQEALRALSFSSDTPPRRGVLVLTVDRPHVQFDTIARLVEAHAEDPSAIWQPAHRGRRGHPILYPHDVAADLLELASGETPRTLLARKDVAARRRLLDVDDPAVVENIDRPEDLERLA
jgi:CTP:molybdopterin cytidylyltransferase MocA